MRVRPWCFGCTVVSLLGVWFSVDELLLAVYTGDVAAVRAKEGIRATKLIDEIA
jgi:hypothetical protein